MAIVEQLGDDSWYVVCEACCRMALVFAIVHLYNFFIFYVYFCIVSVHSFLKNIFL